MNKELNKTYEPKKVEDKIYSFWEDGGFFHAEVDSKKKPYTIVIPPPNITGQLHMGHALDETLQDIIIRFKRMQGYSALWLPGTDHASIATEAKIVESMKKEGISKEDIGREEFLKRAWEWKKQYGGRIVEQLKKLGSSCDWQRERFTLDEGCNKAVNEVFVKLYNKGLIYRGERIINWCPHCKTSISDAEVEFSEKEGSFWHLRYNVKGTDDYLQLATTRPETLLGDTAIAVNPDDERYSKYVGKTVILPLVGREIPVVADEYVEKDFGTGVVKITPAHDPNDFEVGKRHNLPVISVIDEKGIMNSNALKYQGLDRYEARKLIVEDLDKQGYLVKTEPIKHNVGACYRCNTVVEPMVSKQWFVKMEPLAKPAIECVKSGKTSFVPERFSKTYYHWMENIKDWCISRQLWWGHRIPAYYCDDCGEITVSTDNVSVCPKCGSKNIHQDEDTLDTWFSSALWPFSTLGWPDNTEELDYFYPTNTLVTGYDIIFFWVARMIFSALEHTGKPPFETVFIHGLVRDAKGRKMSKSLGNGIDPLEIIDKYGADALRFSLATGNSPGNDMRFTDEKVLSSRNFANKIWNAARFIHMNIDNFEVKNELPDELSIEDKWIISSFNTLVKEVTDNLEKFELGIAVQKLYDFIWEQFCDWYIELVKGKIQDDSESANNARQVLVFVFTNTLKLLHPFMPFITEEIWQTMPHTGESIMISEYPRYSEERKFDTAHKNMSDIMNLIKGIRNRRAEMNVPHSKKAQLFIETDEISVFNSGKEFFIKLASCSHVEISKKVNIENSVTVVTENAKAYMLLDELIDKKAEIARLKKQLELATKELKRCEGKLANEGFVSKAPANIIEKVKSQQTKFSDEISRIKDAIDKLI